MKRNLHPLAIILVFMCGLWSAAAQSTAFTYQGRLTDGGGPANGTYDLQFTIYDAPTNGVAQSGAVTSAATFLSNGVFAVTLDFGASVFNGAERWLEIGARTNGGGAFVPLNPRQLLTPAPYAITAGNVSGTVSAAQLSGTIGSANVSGTYGNAMTFNNAGNSFNGSGAGLTGLNASELASGIVPDARLAANVARTTQVWMLDGNAGTTPGAHFLGTMDNQPLELRVNGRRALRLEPTNDGAARSNMVNVVSGSSVNFVSPGVHGATISGGGAGSYNGIAYTNSVAAPLGTIAGGAGNTIQIFSDGSAIGGGSRNRILGAYNAAISGGVDNTIQSGALNGVIAGGQFNIIQTNAFASTISGGYQNTNQTGARYATLAGGIQNASSAENATVGGGGNNRASGYAATVPGGQQNTAAGNYSFAAGYGAAANHTGAFVWADSQGPDFASTGISQFLIRAAGGVGVGTNNPQSMLHVVRDWDGENGALRLTGDRPTIRFDGGAVAGNQTWLAHVGSDGPGNLAFYRRTGPAGYQNTMSIATNGSVSIFGGVNIDRTDSNSGTIANGLIFGMNSGEGVASKRTPGGTQWGLDFYTAFINRMTILNNGNVGIGTTAPSQRLHVIGNILASGTITPNSDRNAKTGIAPVDPASILERVAALPIKQWRFKTEAENVRHVGPMAQDFHAAFGLGAHETAIATVDADGVALAAIQGLNQKVEDQAAALKAKDAEMKELRQSMAELKALVAKLARE